jgi:glutaredoxin
MENYTVKQLHKKARDLGLIRYSHLRKDPLIKFLNKGSATLKGSPPRKKPPSLKGSPPRKKYPSLKGSPPRKKYPSLKGSPPRKKSPSLKGFPHQKKSPSPKESTPTIKNEIISTNKKGVKWFIISMKGCGYCDNAKDILKKNDTKYGTVELNKDNMDKIYDSIDSMTNKYRYFPIIFYNSKFFGGYTELKKQLNNK